MCASFISTVDDPGLTRLPSFIGSTDTFRAVPIEAMNARKEVGRRSSE